MFRKIRCVAQLGRLTLVDVSEFMPLVLVGSLLVIRIK
jgi:hypothetical protein